MEEGDFRQTLTDITQQDLADHECLIRELGESHPHTIVLRKALPSLERSPEQYTCYMHAFDMIGDPTVQEIMRWLNPRTIKHDVKPDGKFTCHLIEHNILSSIDYCDDGGVIIYFLAAIPRHAGRMNAGRVISKWGLGHLWEHSIYEVPSIFGDETRFFKDLTRQEAVSGFKAYAKRLGWHGKTLG